MVLSLIVVLILGLVFIAAMATVGGLYVKFEYEKDSSHVGEDDSASIRGRDSDRSTIRYEKDGDGHHPDDDDESESDNVMQLQPRDFDLSIYGEKEKEEEEDEDEDEDEEETSKGDEGDEEADGADYTVVELPGIILTPIEHASVYETVESLKDRANVSYVRVDPTGRIDIRHFEELARRSDTVLACVIMGNNEIGTVQDVRALSHICKRNRVHLHCDMTQIVGRYVVNLHDLGVDTATMSAHKFHGPKGVGALYVRRGTRVTNFSTTGGSQELSYRGGTENIGGICGMVSALEHCHYLLALGGADEVRSMRDFVRKAIVKEVPDALLNGHPTDSMYNTLSLCVPLNSRAIVKTLDEAKVYVNVGCACSKGADSKTLMAIGRTPAQVNGSLRISLSYLNTMHECQRLVSELLRAIKEAKATRAKVMAKKVEKVETSSK